MGGPARGGVPLPLPGQSLSHLADHKFHDELLVFILVITDEWHGGAHHLWEEKKKKEIPDEGRQEVPVRPQCQLHSCTWPKT